MPCFLKIEAELSKIFDPREADHLVRMAKKVQVFENQWADKVQEFFDAYAKAALEALMDERKLPEFPLEDLFTEHWFKSKMLGLQQVESGPRVRMGKGARDRKVMNNLRDLQEKMREWKAGRYQPRIGVNGLSDLQRQYLGNLKDFWRKKGEEMQQYGESRKRIIEQFQAQASMPKAQAQTIVRTETTRYQNEVRTDFYAQVDDVTHYLFMAIRDHRTTPWCKTRHGVVYKKGSEVQRKETPPIHWNCRSEIVPLDPDNPRHRKLIDNPSLERENRSPKPLPRGWVSR